MPTDNVKKFVKKRQNYIDPEWIKLLIEAKKIGVTVEEIRHFLKTYDRNYKE